MMLALLWMVPATVCVTVALLRVSVPLGTETVEPPFALAVLRVRVPWLTMVLPVPAPKELLPVKVRPPAPALTRLKPAPPVITLPMVVVLALM